MSEHLPFSELIHSRRSVRKYDQTADFDHDKVQKALELTVLSPNSSNMQLWEFHRVISEEKRAKLAKYCMGQNAAKTANEMVVFVTTPDKWQQRAKMNASQVRENFAGRPMDDIAKRATKYYEKLIPFIYSNDSLGIKGFLRKTMMTFMGIKKPMFREVTKQDLRVCLHKSTSLAAMTFMTAMRDQGYDTCPMEGFDSVRAKKLLGLGKNDEITMIVSVGKRTEEGIYGERHRVPNEDVIFKH
ncbi:nitroreductase family protein [Vibrio breoganii]|uniref:nitroreductase family protein n=1 Tax=Vibrio breoganii TaxID=553239 RepID=UPI00036F5A7D|nr:nitroreductase family protein [Vibrio breoganii]OED97012.1 nitroreductase [Vibrio breoganii ZF-29]OEF82206.1 nitroreductase [Vibrio breoganii 1C10]PML57131.1 nitroreductase [Vibrio breoganii]PMM20869.1 nitroreductase [Vibrio breoganii]PMM85916.1 nitroreductase [Vibrio breoganii]